MKHKSTATNSIFTSRILFACFVLASSTFAIAQSTSEGPEVRGDSEGRKYTCSNRTLSGTYGTQIEGDLSSGLPLRTLTLAHYDGAGKLSGVDHVIVNGNPPDEEWRPSNGTYNVNPDCTGSASIEVPPGFPPLTYHFIVVDHGRQILLVVDGGAIRGIAHKVE